MINKKRLEEEQKRFRQLTEWSFVPSGIEEDNDTEQNQDQSNIDGIDMDNQGGDMDNSMENIPDGMDNQQPNMDMQTPPMDNNQPPMNDMSMPPIDNDDKIKSDDDVLDVTKLTDAQIKMNDKLKSFIDDMGGVNSAITNLMNLVDTLDKKIDDSNNQIKDLELTIKERLPNEEEKIQQRAEDGFPFSNNPNDINSVHAKDPNTKKNITAGDIANFNRRDIEQSFSDIDDLRQDINKIFNF